MTKSISSDNHVRISGDSHVAEPTDLWEKHLPAKFRDRALTFPNVEAGKLDRVRSGGWDARERLKDMAADGISAEVLFPTLGTSIYRQFYDKPVDLELAKACERVYNDWMIEFCSEAPDRLWGQALIGLWDIDYAIKEAELAKAAGLKGIATWVAPPDELSWMSDHYERFWSAAEELGMPIGMHINTGFGSYVNRASEDRAAYYSRQAYGHKVVAMKTVSELILSGVFQRHPKLKILLAEFDCGWIPFFLEDLDRKISKERDYLGLSMLPSEYFAQSIRATFMQDGVAGFLLERWGADCFIYSNDYPHPGGIWPHTDDTIKLMLADLPSKTRGKVLGKTVAQMYGLECPTPMARRDAVGFSESTWYRPWLKTPDDFTFDKPKMGLAV